MKFKEKLFNVKPYLMGSFIRQACTAWVHRFTILELPIVNDLLKRRVRKDKIPVRAGARSNRKPPIMIKSEFQIRPLNQKRWWSEARPSFLECV